MTKKQKQEAQESIAFLLQHYGDALRPGSTVYTVLRSVSRSGMSRDIDLYVIENGEPHRITFHAARACGFTYSRKTEALRVGGCGMDMGFHVVSTLSHVLYPDGFGCVGRTSEPRTSCPSNDHSNGDRDYTPHGFPRGGIDDGTPEGRTHWHRSGDYAIQHRWM